MYSFREILAGAVGLALVHGLLPNHWFPFVAVARARGWSRGRTLGVTAVAASLHVVVTAALGFSLAWLAKGAEEAFGEVLRPASGIGLFSFGVAFVVADLTRGHRHQHAAQNVLHEHRRSGDALVVGSLLLYLTLSPCEAMLPLFAVGYTLTWLQLVSVAVSVAVVTVAAMTGTVNLVMKGMADRPLKALEERELLVFGSVLVVLSLTALI
jgi:hypothetical protein